MLKLLNLFGIHKIHDNAFSAGYWERKYIAGQTKWDNGKPSPALVNFLELNSFKPGKIAVLVSIFFFPLDQYILNASLKYFGSLQHKNLRFNSIWYLFYDN